jgi:hypothetical protein
MIYSQDIRPDTRFMVNGVTYTAESIESVRGYTGKYVITARTDTGTLAKLTLWAGETVAEAPPAEIDVLRP